MKIAVVGVTGLVGQVMLQVLEEVNFPFTSFIPVASERSVGKTVRLKGVDYTVMGMDDAIAAKPDIALFSAGGETSKLWAPRFAGVGTTVIDNSSAWRMDPAVKLVVPEINADTLQKSDKIIANPNCSTIQMVAAIGSIHKTYKIDRLVISTYQSYTGTGAKAVKQYNAEKEGKSLPQSEMAYPHPIFENCIPHCDIFLENGYTKEEMKLVHETRKIIGDDKIKITATAVRVPVDGGHSESVNLELREAFEINDIKKLIAESPGVTVMDDINQNIYPMPLLAKNKNEVFVGRIRRDESIENGLHLWIVSDNLRKGAATNAIQIAQYLHKQGLV